MKRNLIVLGAAAATGWMIDRIDRLGYDAGWEAGYDAGFANATAQAFESVRRLGAAKGGTPVQADELMAELEAGFDAEA